MALREKELDLFARNPNSSLGLRLAAVRNQLLRLELGLPVGADSFVQAVAGISVIIPLAHRGPPRAVPAQKAEVAAR